MVFHQGPGCFLGNLSMTCANSGLSRPARARWQAPGPLPLQGPLVMTLPLLSTLPSSERPDIPVHPIRGSVLYYPRKVRLANGEGGINHCSQLNGVVQICWKCCLLSTVQIMKIPCAEDNEMSHRTADGAFVQPCELCFKTSL